MSNPAKLALALLVLWVVCVWFAFINLHVWSALMGVMLGALIEAALKEDAALRRGERREALAEMEQLQDEMMEQMQDELDVLRVNARECIHAWDRGLGRHSEDPDNIHVLRSALIVGERHTRAARARIARCREQMKGGK